MVNLIDATPLFSIFLLNSPLLYSHFAFSFSFLKILSHRPICFDSGHFIRWPNYNGSHPLSALLSYPYSGYLGYPFFLGWKFAPQNCWIPSSKLGQQRLPCAPFTSTTIGLPSPTFIHTYIIPILLTAINT